MFSKIRRWLLIQFRDNFIICFTVSSIFIIGIIIGAVTIKILNMEQKNEIIIFLNSFFKGIKGNKFESSFILKQSIIDNFKTIGLVWVTGIIMVGLFVIPVIVVFRGFAIGFTVGFFVNEYGIMGLLFSILGILPHNLLIIPSILSIASIGMTLSINNFKKRDLNIKTNSLFFNIANYSILILIFTVLTFTGCLIEAYISPIFLRLLANHLH